MEISFYDFENLHDPTFKSQILKRFEEIISNNEFIEGKYNTLFEKNFSEFLGAKHSLLVANGTDAIEIALKAYDIGPGDKVAVPGITFYASAEAIINVGATPVFVDVQEQTGLISIESFKKVSEKHQLAAVIPVHIYGLPANIEELEKICLAKNIVIIEDAAQAHGAQYFDQKMVGSRNNIATFSFYPTKNLSAFGDAGALSFNDSELSEKIKSLRNHGRGNDNIVGRNSRCDHLQAAVLELKLQDFKQKNESRKKAAIQYYERLWAKSEFNLIPEEYIEHSSWHLFPILLKSQKDRTDLVHHLNEKKIGNALYYPTALSEFGALKQFEGPKQVAEDFSKRVLCLPMHCFLESKQIDYVASEINKFFRKTKGLSSDDSSQAKPAPQINS